MNIFNHLGLAEQILVNGTRLDKNVIIHNGEVKTIINFQHGTRNYERNISISQQKLEETLTAPLRKNHILYNHEFITLCDNTEQGYYGIIKDCLTFRNTTIKSKFIVAADGGKSLIRQKLGLTFDGQTTPERSFSFDARVLSPLDSHTMYMFSKGIVENRVIFVPISSNLYKISGRLATSTTEQIGEGLLEELVFRCSGIQIDKKSIEGLLIYHTQSRISSKFSMKNAFLLGDAAHVFYPAGGYGLNLAVEDAFVLAQYFDAYLKKQIQFHNLKDYEIKRKEVALRIQADATSKKMQLADTSKRETIKEKQAYPSQRPAL
jgi:2-polyprenyl-6-methoxyphenol hydroxylase-like FAD-dependent oxidoreductase